MSFTIRRIRYKIILLAFAAALIVLAVSLHENTLAAGTSSKAEYHTLVIDAGHGGIDSGALAPDGTKESSINLAMALKLQSISELFGQKYVMTRSEDVSTTESVKYSEHDELVYRAELINATDDPLLICIHQNSFLSAIAHGTLVMFGEAMGSDSLAREINSEIIAYLHPESRNVAEPISKKFYITAHTGCPAILLECGFMTNPSDLIMLKSESYQLSLMSIVFAAFLRFETGKITA